MIKAIGVDIVQIPRIEALLKKDSDRFIAKVLVGGELLHYHNLSAEKKAAFLAKRFAAKEAVAKALGGGIGNPCKFTDIEIIKLASGQPQVKIHHPDIDVAPEKIHISISDDYPVATAFVVISE